jgi:hypothetical protein
MGSKKWREDFFRVRWRNPLAIVSDASGDRAAGLLDGNFDTIRAVLPAVIEQID